MAIDYQARIDALDLLTLAGADAANRTSMNARLANEGGKYDSARTALGPSSVDAAQAAGDAAFASATTTWATTTQPVHDSADQFGRFIVGGSPIVFASDGSAGPALFERLADADTALSNEAHPKHALRDELRVHTRAATQAYGQRPTAPTYGAPYTTRTYLLGGIPGTTRGYNLFEFERDVLGPLIAEADLLIDELS